MANYLQTAPVAFGCHKISIFIHSLKEKKKRKTTYIYKYFVCLILTLKNVQFRSSSRCWVSVSCHPVWYFSSHVRFPQSGPQTAVKLTQWRPPVLAYKIDMEKGQTKLNTLFSASTSSGVAVAVLWRDSLHSPLATSLSTGVNTKGFMWIRSGRSSVGQNTKVTNVGRNITVP